MEDGRGGAERRASEAQVERSGERTVTRGPMEVVVREMKEEEEEEEDEEEEDEVEEGRENG